MAEDYSNKQSPFEGTTPNRKLQSKATSLRSAGGGEATSRSLHNLAYHDFTQHQTNPKTITGGNTSKLLFKHE